MRGYIQRDRQAVALVTGGSGSIGGAVALRLARDGYSVIVNDISARPRTNALLRKLKSQGGHCSLVCADVSNRAQVTRMMRRIGSEYGRLDVVVHCAGSNVVQSFRDTDFQTFERVLRVNLLGGAYVSRAALPLLDKGHTPRIIFVGSMSSFVSRSGGSNVAYAVSKAGIVTLMHSLARELAPGILVNAVVPGYIDSSMFRTINTVTDVRRKRSTILLKRLGTPDDVAGVVSFLLSDDARYITGQCVHVNGGAYLG